MAVPVSVPLQFDLAGKFAPAGRCIYCHADGPNVILTSEHIVPFFMGGNAELPQSSCTECNKITSRLDGYCANQVMREFRHHLGIQSRTKSKPERVDITFRTEKGFVNRSIAFDSAPHFMMLPEFEEPGIILGQPPNGVVVPRTGNLWATRDFVEKIDKFRQPGDLGWQVKVGGNYALFCRFIAKIGLASAVACLGYDSRRSPLGDVVLGKNKFIRHYVGCDGDRLSKGITVTETPPIETLSVRIGFQKYGLPGHPALLACEITPFTEFQSPTYCVVIGEAPDAELEMLIQSPQGQSPPKV